ncbi:MAG TPA: hypothetical protein VJA25_02030 [Dehalococcoidia bacterium]|nr:hypothetical protein [Dehalococcoidia bacterium]
MLTIIIGPRASGKTAYAIAKAEQYRQGWATPWANISIKQARGPGMAWRRWDQDRRPFSTTDSRETIVAIIDTGTEPFLSSPGRGLDQIAILDAHKGIVAAMAAAAMAQVFVVAQSLDTLPAWLVALPHSVIQTAYSPKSQSVKATECVGVRDICRLYGEKEESKP